MHMHMHMRAQCCFLCIKSSEHGLRPPQAAATGSLPHSHSKHIFPAAHHLPCSAIHLLAAYTDSISIHIISTEYYLARCSCILAAGAMIRVSIVSYKSPIMVLLLALLVCVSLVASPATAAAGAEEVHLVPALYVFGDSTVDVGNNQHLPGKSALHLPYGIDFPHSRPTGRFSNGYNVADFVGK